MLRSIFGPASMRRRKDEYSRRPSKAKPKKEPASLKPQEHDAPYMPRSRAGIKHDARDVISHRLGFSAAVSRIPLRNPRLYQNRLRRTRINKSLYLGEARDYHSCGRRRGRHPAPWLWICFVRRCVLKVIGFVMLLAASFCFAQDPGDFKPATSNVLDAQYPKVDGKLARPDSLLSSRRDEGEA